MARAGSTDNLWTWRGSAGRDIAASGRYYAKGMRIAHLLVSACLLTKQPPEATRGPAEQPEPEPAAATRCFEVKISAADILGNGAERQGFLGSDHCPMLLVLDY